MSDQPECIRSGRGLQWPVEEAGSWWREGMPVEQIARQAGVSTHQAWDRIQYYRLRRPDLYPARRRQRPTAPTAQDQIDARKADEDHPRRLRAAALRLSPDDALWLAGVLDACGTIAISGQEICIRLHSVRAALIHRVAAVVGQGRTYALRRRRHLDHAWDLRYPVAVTILLQQVAPYMQVRQALAEAVARWPHVARGELITEDIALARATIREEVRSLLAAEDTSDPASAARPRPSPPVPAPTVPVAAPPWTADLDDRLASLWADGLSVVAIASRLSRTPASISVRAARLRHRCPKRRGRGDGASVSPDRWEEALRLVTIGVRLTDIAADLGVTPQAVSLRAAAAGIKKPSKSELIQRFLETVC